MGEIKEIANSSQHQRFHRNRKRRNSLNGINRSESKVKIVGKERYPAASSSETARAFSGCFLANAVIARSSGTTQATKVTTTYKAGI